MTDSREMIEWELDTSEMYVKLEQRMTSFSVWVGDNEDINTWIEVQFKILDHALLIAEAMFQNGHELQVILGDLVTIGQRYNFSVNGKLVNTPVVRRVMKRRNRKSGSRQKPPPFPPGAR